MSPMPKHTADALEVVREAAEERADANAAWRCAIIEAHKRGASYRQIALVAGVSHQRIAQIVPEGLPKRRG